MIMVSLCKQAPHAIETEYLVCVVYLSILYYCGNGRYFMHYSCSEVWEAGVSVNAFFGIKMKVSGAHAKKHLDSFHYLLLTEVSVQI